MSDQPHCQSCSRPIEGDADFGTESDGRRSLDYCSCCYRDGAFTEPQVARDEMVARVIVRVARRSDPGLRPTAQTPASGGECTRTQCARAPLVRMLPHPSQRGRLEWGRRKRSGEEEPEEERRGEGTLGA